MMSTTALRSLLLAGSLALPGGLAAAQSTAPLPVQPARTSPAQMAAFTHPQSVPQDLARVDAALNGTSSFTGRFTQYGSDGTVQGGTVELQRPGRMRFEYDAPNPLLIVSDGVTLVYHDKALDTFDRVPLSATPFDYFLKENVDLARDTEVIAFQKLTDQWRVSMRDGSGQQEGVMTLVFDPQTLALTQWIILDEFGQQTAVQLSDLRYNERIDPRRFVLREDSRRDRRRR